MDYLVKRKGKNIGGSRRFAESLKIFLLRGLPAAGSFYFNKDERRGKCYQVRKATELVDIFEEGVAPTPARGLYLPTSIAFELHVLENLKLYPTLRLISFNLFQNTLLIFLESYDIFSYG